MQHVVVFYTMHHILWEVTCKKYDKHETLEWLFSFISYRGSKSAVSAKGMGSMDCPTWKANCNTLTKAHSGRESANPRQEIPFHVVNPD
jgi:hypothetical protein